MKLNNSEVTVFVAGIGDIILGSVINSGGIMAVGIGFLGALLILKIGD